jgi:chaperonin GroES
VWIEIASSYGRCAAGSDQPGATGTEQEEEAGEDADGCLAMTWLADIKKPYDTKRETMKLQPLYDQVLVRRESAEKASAGGIIIPDNAKEKPSQGEVLAIGRGKLLESGAFSDPLVHAGDRILFSKYAGVETNIDGEEYVLVRGDDILGVFKGSE